MNALLTIKWVELVEKNKFAAVAIYADNETSIVYIASLADINFNFHPF